MSITLDLRPDIEAFATARAEAQGVSLEAYLLTVIEQLVPPAPGTASLEEFESGLDELAQGGESLPVLSEWSVSRAGIYHDHD
jgi:hypothetical protein